MTRPRMISLIVAGVDALLALAAAAVAREGRPLALLALFPTLVGLAYIWFPETLSSFANWWRKGLVLWPRLEIEPAHISLAGWGFLALVAPTMAVMAAFDLL